MLIRIHCDGACSNNQEEENLGGWGYVLEALQGSRILKTASAHGSAVNTTNNRMEMTALIEALSALTRDGLHIEVYSDSGYIVKCFKEKWYEGWQASNWKNGKIKNIDLWKRLLDLVNKHRVDFFQVKGHLALENPDTDLEKHLKKFNKDNETELSLSLFKHIIKRNNEVDGLAQKGIKAIRPDNKR